MTGTFLASGTEPQSLHQVFGWPPQIFCTEEFHPLGCLQPCKSSRQAFCRPYVCIAEGEERHLQYYLRSGVGHQKGLLEDSNLSQFVLEQKTCRGHRNGLGYYGHSRTAKNMDARNIGACTELELSRTARLKDPKSTRLGVRYSRRGCLEDPKWRRPGTWPQ